MKKLLSLIFVVFLSQNAVCQKHEIGLLAGGANMIGDIGRESYIFPENLMLGILYRRNLNSRIALRASGTYADLSIKDSNAASQARVLRNLNLENAIYEVAAEVEFNFFDFDFIENKVAHTPYIMLGVAGIGYSVLENNGQVAGLNEAVKQEFSFAIPFGVGYKTKFIGNTNLGVELRARYTFVDNLDLTDNPNAFSVQNSSNNDWYVFTGISVTTSIGSRKCYYTYF